MFECDRLFTQGREDMNDDRRSGRPRDIVAAKRVEKYVCETCENLVVHPVSATAKR